MAQLLEQCRKDLKFTNEILFELENPDLHETRIKFENPAPDQFTESVNNGERKSLNSAVLGGEAIRRLTNNIEALTFAASRSDVQSILQAMHVSMVRCLKLIPAQR